MKRRLQPLRVKRQTTPLQLVNSELIETEEFKLLHKLFVPNNYLIKNNQVSVPYLINNLPVIIDDSQINLQIHLFISSILVNYVNSWYLGKLNTNNWEFVQIVYGVINDLTKELTRRVLTVDLLELTNQVCDIVNDHVEDLLDFEGDTLKLLQSLGNNTLIENPLEEYLSRSHIIFNDSNDSELIYHRILCRKILDISLEPVNSKITLDLVNLLLSDLVVVKLIEKLASPVFIMGLIERASDKVDQKLSEKSEGTVKRPAITTRLRLFWNSLYNFVHDDPDTDMYTTASIFNTSVFRLFGTITNFTQKKPLLAAILQYVWNAVYSQPFLNRKINSIVMRQVDSQISQAFSSANVCNIVSGLRESIFNKNNDNSPVQPPISLTELSSKIANLVKTFVKSLPPATIQEIDEESLSSAVYKVLLVFNFEIGVDNSTAHPTNDLNKLLVQNILDCVVVSVFPELSSS